MTNPIDNNPTDDQADDERASESAHEKSNNTPNLEWIVAEDDRVAGIADLDVRWAGTPLARSGLRAYVGAILLVGLAIALATPSVAGFATGPALIGLAPVELGLVVTTITLPLWWLGAIPIILGVTGVVVGLLPLVRSVRTEYVLTSDTLYARTRGIRRDQFAKLALERVVEITRHQSLVGRLLSYGTITFRTVEAEIPKVVCKGIHNPREVEANVLTLDASTDSPLDRKQEYVRVIPSTGERAPSEIVNQIRPLHALNPTEESFWQRINPFASPDPLTFDFTIYSNGTDSPIEFYYSTDQHLSTLYDRLNSAYPDTVEIERVTVDLAEKLVAPEQYSYEEFETALEKGALQTSVEEVEAITRVHGDQPLAADGAGISDGPGTGTVSGTGSEPELGSESGANTLLGGQLPSVDLDALRKQEEEENRDPGSLRFGLDTPVDTGEGVLARPHPDDVEPYSLRWTGSGDPMTPIRLFDEELDGEDFTKDSSHAPLTVLIDHFATTDHPIVFQAAFEGESDSTHSGNQRIERIRGDRETWGDVIIQAIEDLIYGAEPQQEHHPQESQPIPEADRDLIDNLQTEDLGHTFTANLRVVTVPAKSASSDTSELKQSLRSISTVFDPLEGRFYGIESEKLYDKGLVARRSRTFSRRCFNRVLNRDVVTGKRLGRSTPDLHLDPNELCNMIIVPSTEHLTDEATKETHANPESRTSLPGLDAAQRRQYTTGMVLGQDPTSSVDGPLRLPPALQTRHWLACATTGAGKSQLVNRMLLSLAETTLGPNILFEPKGDGMCVNYLMGHYKKYGSLEDAYYFREPEILPAVSFFDLRPALDAGHDRETAVKEKADHFHALMRMIMGADRHEQAFVANEVLTFLIYALFDPVHGDDVFGLDDLVNAATRMQQNQELPDISDINQDIHKSLANQFTKEDHQFHTTMGAVLNRLNRLKEDRHLHWMLRHKPGREADSDPLYGFHEQDVHFDFRDILDEDVTVLFDIGDLTLDAQRGLTTILLSDLWHSIQHRQQPSSDHVVNVILEEAAPFIATELVADQLLPQGRSAGLSLGFVMQYPEQVRSWDDGNGAYEELLTEVHTKLVGDISITDRFAKTFTHDDLSVEDVRNRNNRIASGEWFTKLASPQFGEERPAPLTLHSLPIISGHPESDDPLSDAEQKRFDEDILPEVIERTDEEYGLDVPTHEDTLEWSPWSDAGTGRSVGSPPTPDGSPEPTPEGDPESESDQVGSPGLGTDRDPESDTQATSPKADADGTNAPPEQSADEENEDAEGADSREEDESNSESDADQSSEGSMGGSFFGGHEEKDTNPIDDETLRARGLSRDDATFLKRVLDAMNRDLPGYTLLEGMDELEDGLPQLDVSMLIERGLLEKARVNRRPYYTLLPEGRELLDETITAETGVGDLGEKTPHKVGVELLFQWLSEQEDVERAERYYQQDPEAIFDVVGFDADGDLIWVGEVEMTSNNPTAVTDDYDKMAAVDADAVWAFSSRDDARNIVNLLADHDRVSGRVGGRAARTIAQIQERVDELDADGLTTVQTFRRLGDEIGE
ncbi:PH domain-containing protein [Saliphagus sp. LR7]|uniref:PH domain-containing protein n=1 Tax=Saliphagus sp. LR7 TaxID=2282654 RepID=UPI000DF8675C|nr:PH domain-containing protein [Saliphagus sp. LR7]